MRKFFTILLVFLFATAIFIPMDLYVIGEPVDGEQIWYEICQDGSTLQIHIGTSSSAIALRGVKVRQEGSTH